MVSWDHQILDLCHVSDLRNLNGGTMRSLVIKKNREVRHWILDKHHRILVIFYFSNECIA